MKAALFSLAFGSLLGSVLAVHPRHARFHELKARGADDDCGCAFTTTITMYGEARKSTQSMMFVRLV